MVQKQAWIRPAWQMTKKIGGNALKYGFGALSLAGAAGGAQDVFHGVRGAIHGDPEGRSTGESWKRALGGAAAIPMNLMFMRGVSPTSMLTQRMPWMPAKGIANIAGDMAMFHQIGGLQNAGMDRQVPEDAV